MAKVIQARAEHDQPSLRPLQGPALVLDLNAELAALRRDPGFERHGRSARTLAKYPDTRLVLELLRAGQRFAPNGPSERLAVHCLAGHVRVHLPGPRAVDVQGGGLCTLDRFMAIEIEAVEESSCLLTVSWPASA